MRMEAEGKKVRTGGNFHGKGFKFDETEANFASEKKKFEKAALGLEDSDDEDIEGDINQQILNMLNTKRTVKEIKVRDEEKGLHFRRSFSSWRKRMVKEGHSATLICCDSDCETAKFMNSWKCFLREVAMNLRGYFSPFKELGLARIHFFSKSHRPPWVYT